MNRTSKKCGTPSSIPTKTDHNESPGRRGKEQDYTKRNNCWKIQNLIKLIYTPKKLNSKQDKLKESHIQIHCSQNCERQSLESSKRKKCLIVYKGNNKISILLFKSEAMKVRRQYNNIFKETRIRKSTKILYLAKLSFINEGDSNFT